MPENTTANSPAEHDEEPIEPEPTVGLADPDNARAYSERLYAAWWLWLAPLIGATLLASSIDIGYPALPVWLPYLVLLPIAVVLMLAAGRTVITVTTTGDDPELHVGSAHLPLRFIGAVEIIDRNHKQAALGPEFDPAAFLLHRGSIGPVVRLELTDPADETPYWIFSTRHPARLAYALGIDTTTATAE